MTISQRIFAILKQKKKKQKELSAYTGISEAAISDWKKKGTNPSADKIFVIANFLEVSPEYLLTGTEKTLPSDLSENEQEMMELFSKFTDREQIKIIGKIEEWLAEKQRRADAVKPNTKTAYIAARSFDNAPPRTVTGDFSDVLNAPDSTDEY